MGIPASPSGESVVGRKARGDVSGEPTRPVRLKNVDKLNGVGPAEWIKQDVLYYLNLPRR